MTGHSSCGNVAPLCVPTLDADTDILAAALAYADHGWYVLPVRADRKDPGSVVGKGWQHQSSRDADQIAAWLAGTDHGIALHVGRSGAIVFDVDNPDQIPAVLAEHLDAAPYQSTRPGTPDRGHYIYRQPDDRTIGNGLGRLGGGWGDVRGRNGVIIAAPTAHPNPDGRYEWVRSGVVPPLPNDLADLLDDAGPASGAATDREVAAFLATYTANARPELLRGKVAQFETKARHGQGRHSSMVPIVAGAMEEAAAGFYPSASAVADLTAVFVAAVTADGSRSDRSARAEMAGIVSWGVGQAAAANAAEIRVQVAERMPRDDADGLTALVAPHLRARIETTAPQADRTDVGNATLLELKAVANHRYCPDTGRWLAWDGQRWADEPDDGPLWQLARQVAAELPRDDKEEYRHYARSNSRRGLEDMVALLRKQDGMRVRVGRLDADRGDLNTPAGIVDLHAGQLRSGDRRERFHTKITGVGVDFDRPAPRWNRFLDGTFDGDTELIGYVQALAGLAAHGTVTHHVLPFLFGGGSNGKGVLTEVLDAVFGDYSIAAPANFLLVGRDKHETEIARLHGARLVICSELNEGSKFDEAKVKVLTGGDILSGRFMRGDFFDFIPSHTLFLMGNHQPEVSAGGTSFWRRLRLIPFLHTVPPEQRNPHLAAELVAEEGPSILAWIVAGARRVAAAGLIEPASVKQATAEYADEEDPYKRFIDEVLTLDEGGEHRTTLDEIYAAWRRRAFRDNEGAAVTKIGLARKLAAHCVKSSVVKDGGQARKFYRTVAAINLAAAGGDAWEGLVSK